MGHGPLTPEETIDERNEEVAHTSSINYRQYLLQDVVHIGHFHVAEPCGSTCHAQCPNDFESIHVLDYL
jgi:hypothetical protein